MQPKNRLRAVKSYMVVKHFCSFWGVITIVESTLVDTGKAMFLRFELFCSEDPFKDCHAISKAKFAFICVQTPETSPTQLLLQDLRCTIL